ncbi:hypothetical protein DFJ58DRAFT_871786 [Suillus subalutaceus]|uniref:uncharacterized protein n=1 Tax=Suillus subalutaceus TaxID=48586 RepID=UPI001B85B8F2|nr:uncharacterized protein DFJ58DRAFT_871786 [Suillus subalutaceus]KAG1861787.1 hypothetical protein DFJ58DRAFT_871786 [Suillus subalutaceus]
MAGTPPFGVLLGYFTSKSTNSVTPLMHTPVPSASTTGGQLPAASGPQDVHPTAYASTVSSGPPSGDNLHLPPPAPAPASRSSPGPFRGGPPPPVVLDESRHMPSHTPLALMDVDRPPILVTLVLLSCYNRRLLVPQSSGLSQAARIWPYPFRLQHSDRPRLPPCQWRHSSSSNAADADPHDLQTPIPGNRFLVSLPGGKSFF